MTRFYRSLLALLLGLVLGGTAALSYAATVPYKFHGMNVTREGGATYLRGTSPSEVASAGVSVSSHVMSASGSANWYAGAGALLQSGGVVFNAAIPIAASAASIAVTAVRANPAGLITSSIASYLLSKGIEYANGEFQVPSTPSSYFPGKKWCFSSPVNDCDSDYNALIGRQASRINTSYTGYGTWQGHTIVSATATSVIWRLTYSGGNPGNFTINSSTDTCSTGYRLVSGQCVPVDKRAPTEAEWDQARAGYWPDAANLDLVKKGVPLPTDKPVFSPPYKDVDLSDPYTDPVTGKRFKDTARVTPQPSAPDTAEVQFTKQEVDANGQPVTANGTPVPPVEESDLCKKNPGIIACMQGDVPTAPDITNQDKNIVITPDSGWGPDSGTCPADRVSTLHGGVQHVQSWQPTCQFLSMFRPALLAVAWFSAVLIAVGIYKTYS